MYNQYNLEADIYESSLTTFKHFLHAEKISKGSIRSYLSDIRFFFSWLKKFLKENHLFSSSLSQTLSLISPKVLSVYQAFLFSQQTPVSTINRRFSSLRKFGNFCQSQNWTNLNPFDALRNISQNDKNQPESYYRLKDFRLYLWQNQASQSTIKNYLSDVRQFIDWAKKAKILIQPD